MQVDKCMDWQIDVLIGIWIDRYQVGYTYYKWILDRQVNKQIDNQVYKWIDKQIGPWYIFLNQLTYQDYMEIENIFNYKLHMCQLSQMWVILEINK